MENMEINRDFWNRKKVFITGHTGFKGGWLALWLSSLGAEIKGYSLEPLTNPNLFEVARVSEKIESEIGDIRDFEKLNNCIRKFNPEIIIHMAAQPLVRYSYRNPVETYSTNVMGTVNVLESGRNCPNLRVFVNITTDKCYENTNNSKGYVESDPMGGFDPYSSSKGCAELVTSSYLRSFYESNNIGLASVRAGNILGGGDWSEDRLIPDILHALNTNSAVSIRNPKSTRPWQHVLEPLSGYLILAKKLFDNPASFSSGWNFGPEESGVKSVGWVLENIISKVKNGSWQLDTGDNPHEAKLLMLDISKAKNYLNWQPTWNLDHTLTQVLNWNDAWLSGKDMQKITLQQINEFVENMKN